MNPIRKQVLELFYGSFFCIQTLVSQGYITGDLKESFPAANITTPDNFVSLLYYFGLLTISGTYEGKTKLTKVWMMEASWANSLSLRISMRNFS